MYGESSKFNSRLSEVSRDETLKSLHLKILEDKHYTELNIFQYFAVKNLFGMIT